MRKLAFLAAAAALALPLGVRHAPHFAQASSHREAPLTAADPEIDSTDFYSFVSPDAPNTVTFIANYIPLEAGAGGPNYYQFGDDTHYDINIDNVGDGQPHITYRFEFVTHTRNTSTFLYNTGPITSLTDPNWNVYQTMKVTRIDATGSTVLGDNLPTPPVNIGAKSTPNYDALANAAINTLPGGTKVFAGQRSDPFFIDLGAFFDLLTIRKLPGNAGGGVNTLKGFNVHSIVLQVPISQLTKDGSTPTDAKSPAAIIGSWTAAALQATSVLSANMPGPVDSGGFVQVSRLGMPLTNEILIPRGLKDWWNASAPADDAQFLPQHAKPEPAALLNLLYGIKVPTAERKDIEAIFLLGVPGLNNPGGTPADELRLNVAIPVNPTPSRMGVLAKDTQGFPNGRRLTDDVVDIAEQAVAGATYPLIDATFTPDPLATQLGDGVDAPDKAPLASFPYVASPSAGYP